MNLLLDSPYANREKCLIHPLRQYDQENKLTDDPENKKHHLSACLKPEIFFFFHS